MVLTRSAAPHRRRTAPPSTLALKAAVAVALAVVALIVIGGYGLGWRWTGLSGKVTLWDWLQVLALPVGIAAAPLIWRRREHLTRRHRTTGALGLTTFTALVLAGYLIPWAWTGFSGNTLWDWLELALLPLVVATASLWAEVPAGRRLRILAAAATALGVLALCGYLVPWGWTGFSGNTAWDWFKLLLLPVLVPTVIVPAVTAVLDTRLTDRPPTDR